MPLRRIIKSIPNTITCCNLLCGALACIFAFSSLTVFPEFCNLCGSEIVWILICAAAVFDFCDGAAARLLNAPSALGKELDSLADLVSFGLAPALLLFNLLGEATHSATLPYVSLFIPVMGALRLAKFNIDDSQSTTFRGLPIPANAIFWIGATAWITDDGFLCLELSNTARIIAAVVVVAISLLMVCNMRMFSLKFKNFSIRDNLVRYFLIVATVAFVAIFGIVGLAPAILCYIIVSASLQKSLEQTAH